jgi:GntR family transcriptional regulator
VVYPTCANDEATVPELQEVLPKYLQIAGHIRDQIVRGDLKPGDEIPSERALALTWNVARPTATKAVESLRVQGLVESRQGAGTYVREVAAAPRARERYERARDHGTMYSDTETVEFVGNEIVDDPPEHVRQALRLAAGAGAIRRARVIKRRSGDPIELSISWFTSELAAKAPGLLVPERLRGGTAKYIAAMTGQRATYARDQVAARLATDEEAIRLQLTPAAPVLVYQLTVYDASDSPVQFDEATYPPDTWAFRQEYALAD